MNDAVQTRYTLWQLMAYFLRLGAIAGSVVVLAQRSITDILTALLAVGTTALLWKVKKVPNY